MTNYEILRKPIQPNEIEWRVQSAKGGKTTIVPYIQSRAVMNRFDDPLALRDGKTLTESGKAKV